MYISLKALLNEKIGNNLVRCIYEIKALCIEGEFPGIPGGRKFLDSTVYTVNYIATSPLKKLYSFDVSKEVLSELEDITAEYRKRSIDKPLKSLEMLESLYNVR